MSAIGTYQLTKRYGPRIGIDGVTLNVDEGMLFGFLGPNGSGKTTTIRVLLGLLRATSGEVRVLGRDPWREGHVIRREIGYLPGDLRLYPWLSCKEAIRVFGRIRRRDLRRAGRELASRFNLDWEVSVQNMSRGMRQKLGLILALAHRPRLLVLDEPATGLDPLIQETLYEHLRELARARHTIFFSSHSLSEVERLCDHVVILREGRVVADAPLNTLRARAQRFVTIRWRSSARHEDITVPPFLTLRERNDREWRAALSAPAMELVRWCANQPVEDLSIGQPDLGALFRQYYVESEPST